MAERSVSPAGVKANSALEALVAIVNDLAAGMNTLTAQLDADAGVTDTDYAANVGTIDTMALDNGQTPT